MSTLRPKYVIISAAVLGIFFLGWIIGFAQTSSPWQVSVNGQPSSLPVHVIKNMLFVSFQDLAKLPGWSVQIDLGSRKVSVNTPNALAYGKPAESPKKTNPSQNANPGNTTIEAANKSSGPPDNVRMTVQAALASLGEMQKTIDAGPSPSDIEKKMEETTGIVRQAINMLWSLPRTRTLQADLQVALEDLQSQVGLYLAKDQAQEGILLWTHPTAQGLLLKYPDLRPCHVTKGKADGLDANCGRNMLSDLETEDVRDVQRDLNSY